MSPTPIKIAVFASGKGSNAQKIIDHFRDADKGIEVSLIVCNNPEAGVLSIAKKEGIPTLLIEREAFRATGYAETLKRHGIGFVVLAGFLWKVPPALISAFPEKIINLHPALLPKYGGKGMYGMAVHRAVIAAGEKESGITIHLVDEQYDHGAILLQKTIPLDPHESPESLAEKIHRLEHLYLPGTIEEIILQKA